MKITNNVVEFDPEKPDASLARIHDDVVDCFGKLLCR